MKLQDIVNLLNEALKLDSNAIETLINFRVPCNQNISSHPHIKIRADAEGNFPTLGFLGLLNGLADKEDKYILVTYDINTNCLIKFSLSPKDEVNFV